MYVVTVVKEVYDEGAGVELAGIFDTEEKAMKAKAEVTEWLENEGYEDFEVFALLCEPNKLKWYEIEKTID